MAIMTHAKFHFNWLMLTSIFGIWASEPPAPGPGKRLKRPGLIGLKVPNKQLNQKPFLLSDNKSRCLIFIKRIVYFDKKFALSL